MRFILGDCLDVLPTLQPGDLVYADPPFNVGKKFIGRSGASYVDAWPSAQDFVAWLVQRIVAARDNLKESGTFWLHLDHRSVHYAKVACDGIFGADRFLGEIVWNTGNGLRGRRVGPGITHQTILIYSKSRQFYWNASREPFADTSLTMHFSKKDETGRSFRERVVNGKKYRYYADEGRAMGSVWVDCPAMVANSPIQNESTGYPTQKPISLLSRVVESSCPQGGLVIDPFCGSGTTIVAAARLGRDGIGIDISSDAIKIAESRK